MKSHSPKQTPIIVTYRKSTNSDKDKFIDEIFFEFTKAQFVRTNSP